MDIWLTEPGESGVPVPAPPVAAPPATPPQPATASALPPPAAATAPVAGFGGGDNTVCSSDTIPVDIIFSHKTRMQCIIKQLKKRSEAYATKSGVPDVNVAIRPCVPKNGGIIIIVEQADREKPLIVIYPPNQYKIDKKTAGKCPVPVEGGDEASVFQSFADKINAIEAIARFFVLVRHGWGWHNDETNKKRKAPSPIKWRSNEEAAEAWEAGLGYDSNLFASSASTSGTETGENGFEDAVKAGTKLGNILQAAASAREKPLCVNRLYCSDLQRTAETGNIAIAAAKEVLKENMTFPQTMYVLPCNHELPSKTCEGMGVSMAAGLSPSYENESSLEKNDKWGKTFGGKPIAGLTYDKTKYLQFNKGVRKTGPMATWSREHCNEPFPKNIEWMEAPAESSSPQSESWTKWAQTMGSQAGLASQEGSYMNVGGRRKTKQKRKQKRKRRTKRKQKRRRVRVTLCKKKTFHKCKTRKHRKRRS